MEILRESYPLVSKTLLEVVLLFMKNQYVESLCMKDVAKILVTSAYYTSPQSV